MSTVTCNLSLSVDGYSAGSHQSEQRPFGDDADDGWGARLHAWMFDHPEENQAELDRMTDARAYVMGRNMFGPVRGDWDRPWNGWWGDNPPFHAPVFVLTHHAREPQPMDGGTTYHFVTGTWPFDGVPPLNLEQVSSRATSSVTHVTYRVLR